MCDVRAATQKQAAQASTLVAVTQTPGIDVSKWQGNVDWFVDHGRAWSADGRTLPGVLDIEDNPYGATGYGLSQASRNYDNGDLAGLPRLALG